MANVFCVEALSQNTPQLSFNSITTEDGIPSNYITHIEKDHKGFVWFSTSEGIVRYNGHESFRIFNSDNTPALKVSYVTGFAVDHDGIIWIGTKLGGLVRFDSDLDEWTTYLNDVNDPTSLSNNEILSITVDFNNDIWVGTEDGINIYRRETDNFVSYKMSKDDSLGLKSKAILKIYEDDKGWIWLGSWGSGLYLVLGDDINSLKFRQFIPDDQLGSKNVWSVIQDYKNSYWLGTHEAGIFKFEVPLDGTNRADQQDWQTKFKNFTSNYDDASSINSNTIFHLSKDKDNSLWFATTNGIFKLTKEVIEASETSSLLPGIHKYFSNSNDPTSIAGNDVKHIYHDKDGLVWISTFGGVTILNPFNNQFESVLSDVNVASNCQNMAVIGNVLWLAQSEDGLVFYDLNREEKIEISGLTNQFGETRMNGLLKLNEEEIVCTSNNSIYKYNIVNGAFERKEIPNSILSKYSNFLAKCIFNDDQDRLWIGTELGLLQLDYKTDEFKIFEKNINDRKQLTDNSITSIQKGKNGNIWIGTYNGLNEYVETEDDYYFIHHRHDPEDTTSIISNTITALSSTSDHLVIGTHRGILLYDYQQQEFKYDNTSDNRMYAHAIIPLSDSIVWLSSRGGIYNVELNDFKTHIFDKSDGINDLNFNMASKTTDDAGRMYFSNYAGVVRFHPDKLVLNQSPPIVHLSQATVLNRNGERRTINLSERNELNLNYNDFYLEISYAGLNYSKPEKIEFAYILEGFDDDWRHSSRSLPLTYTNLENGEYTLRIRAANENRVWTAEDRSLTINVIPAIWQTLWFKIIGLLLLISLIAGSFFLYTRRVKRNNDYLKSLNSQLNGEIEAKNKYEADLLNSEIELMRINRDLSRSNEELEQFAYVASHDLKEPLRTIGSYTGLIRKKLADSGSDITKYLSTVENAVKRMHEQVDNVLTFSQVGRQDLNYTQVDMNQVCHNIILGLGKKIEEQKTIVEFNELPIVYANDEQMGMLFTNLISNAIKFNSSENPIVKIYQTQDDSEKFWHITVEDNGIGIEDVHQKKIFEIFKRLHSTQNFEGTGIGLALCKKIIDLHHGDIQIDSRIGEYTKFTVILPKEIANA